MSGATLTRGPPAAGGCSPKRDGRWCRNDHARAPEVQADPGPGRRVAPVPELAGGRRGPGSGDGGGGDPVACGPDEVVPGRARTQGNLRRYRGRLPPGRRGDSPPDGRKRGLLWTRRRYTTPLREQPRKGASEARQGAGGGSHRHGQPRGRGDREN